MKNIFLSVIPSDTLVLFFYTARLFYTKSETSMYMFYITRRLKMFTPAQFYCALSCNTCEWRKNKYGIVYVYIAIYIYQINTKLELSQVRRLSNLFYTQHIDDGNGIKSHCTFWLDWTTCTHNFVYTKKKVHHTETNEATLCWALLVHL